MEAIFRKEAHNVLERSRNGKQQKSLIQYVRDKHNQKNGVLLAYNTGTAVHVTWSKCHSPLDKFDKLDGVAYAIERANKPVVEPVPSSIKEAYLDFVSRVVRYYKDKKVVLKVIL